MQEQHPPIIDIIDTIQAIRQRPESSFEYWIMLGSIFKEDIPRAP